MAFYKFNNLHWHLTDGGGWRIEIDSYPLLIQKELGAPKRIGTIGFSTG